MAGAYSSFPEYRRVIELLKSRLSDKRTCSALIDEYEEVLRSIWIYIARLIGDAGARAVLARAVKVAGREAPLVQTLRVDEDRTDFSGLRDHVDRVGCTPPEVMNALASLGASIFRTLFELTGDVLTEPLLRHLEEDRRDQKPV